MTIKQKYLELQENLQKLGSVAIAFSSGVDSTFLLKVAKEVLKEKVIAVTINSSAFPSREFDESVLFCKREGITQITVEADNLSIPGFKENPPERCYICKRDLFNKIIEAARFHGISNVAEGSNMDDMGDYRPGMKAIMELNILSPLKDAQLTKAEIRQLSKDLKLETWDKPSFACLATRFVYGEEITIDKLKMVEKAEMLLYELGFSQFRVRLHGDNHGRIEVLPEELSKIVKPCIRKRILEEFSKYGFDYVSVDLAGYIMGSMNKMLK